MNDLNYNIIIPCARKDLSFIPKVVKYIRKNLIEADRIYIITNTDNISYLQRHLKKSDTTNVVTLDENKMLKNLSFAIVKEYLSKKEWYVRQGWYFQQFLKMGFALTDYAKDYYLSWDADTLPLSQLSFFDDGYPLFTIKKEFHPAYFETMEKLFEGGGKVFDYSFIAEHMLFKTSIMKELICEIEANKKLEGKDWVEKCINACEFSQTDIYKEPYFSEFETYGTYANIHHPDLYRMRQLNTFRGAGYIRGRKISDKMLETISLDLDIASFEYGATPPFPYNINSWLHKHVIPKFEKMINMPADKLPSHLAGIIKRRIGLE